MILARDNRKAKEKNIDLIEQHHQPFTCQCQNCGTVWYPMLREKGRLPRHWWLCPNSCNS